jgi:predicted nucleotidyltransferase
MEILSKVLSGSHLFGLNTEKSDLDYRGCYLPELKDCILGKVKKSITSIEGNDPSTVDKSNVSDTQYFGLQAFINNLSNGEVNSLDLLHARGDNLLRTSEEWEFLYNNKDKFYTKRLDGVVGFVLSQTRKYSNRGVRYNSVVEVIEFLDKVEFPKLTKLKHIWNLLPVNSFAEFRTDKLGNEVYSVCERMVHPTVTVEHALKVFTNYKTLYGQRSIDAGSLDGYDLKAISHAFRCLDELEELIHERNITFPLKNRERILNIKLGIEMPTDDHFVEMDERIEKLKFDLDNSNLPDSVDLDFWNEWVFNVYKKKGF